MNKGFIRISNTIFTDNEFWKELSIIFKHFRPTHIECQHWLNSDWYFYGESDLFDVVKEGEKIPQYDVVFTKHPDNSLTYEFKRLP